MKSIVLTGGGTGGHVIPNVALLDELKKTFDKIYYIGSVNGIEKNIISQYEEITYLSIPTVKFIRSLTPKNLLLPIKLIRCISSAKDILQEIKPNVIFSKGGFVSVPVVFAGAKLKIPIISHESDSSMGLANKLIYKKSNSMCFSFEELAKKYSKKGVYTGSPIRNSILNGNKQNIIPNLSLSNSKPTILITGGSLGAVALNNIIFDSINKLTQKYNIIHIVGRGNAKKMKVKYYNQFEFVNNIEDYFDCCDLVISRSGSNAIFEFLALQKPMILIPLPKTASRGDQIINAKIFEEKGFSYTLYQENLSYNSLINAIEDILKNKDMYVSAMKKANIRNGNKKIINEILKVVK